MTDKPVRETSVAMSSESGIGSDSELIESLRAGSNNIVVAKIDKNEQAVVLDTTFDSLAETRAALKEIKEPRYIFVHHGNHKSYHFVAYTPEDALVRSKMLYASTKSALLRNVGTNVVQKQHLATEIDELDDKSLFASEDTSLEDALSQSERELRDIDRQQASFLSHGTTPHALVSQTDAFAKGALTFVVSDHNIKNLLSDNNVITFAIDINKESVEVINQMNINGSEGLKLLTEHPTYTIYREGERYYFIYSCPSGSKVKERMLYASNKQGFLNSLQETEQITFEKVFEIGDPDELTANDFALETKDSNLNELSSKKFTKPRGPTRRTK